MNRIFVVIAVLLISFSCKENNEKDGQNSNVECVVKGRWVVMNSTLYEFDDSLKHTIYSTNGKFGTLDSAIPNPNKWWMEGDSLVVDLNFGNIVKYDVTFDCDCKVMELNNSNGKVRYWKEGFDIGNCPD